MEGLQTSTCVTTTPGWPNLDENVTAIESPFLISVRLTGLPAFRTFASAGTVKPMVQQASCFTLTVLAVKLTTSPRNGLLIMPAVFGAELLPHPPLTMGVPTAQMSMTVTSQAADVIVFIGSLCFGLLVELGLMMPQVRPTCNEFQVRRRPS